MTSNLPHTHTQCRFVFKLFLCAVSFNIICLFYIINTVFDSSGVWSRKNDTRLIVIQIIYFWVINCTCRYHKIGHLMVRVRILEWLYTRRILGSIRPEGLEVTGNKAELCSYGVRLEFWMFGSKIREKMRHLRIWKEKPKGTHLQCQTTLSNERL